MDYCYNVYLFFGLKTAPVGFQVCRLFISAVFMLKKTFTYNKPFQAEMCICLYVYIKVWHI